MNEDRYRDSLGDFLDGFLEGTEHREIEAHLKSCEACRAELGDLAEIKRAAASLDRLSPRPVVWERIRTSISSQSTRDSQATELDAGQRPSSIWQHRWALAATLIVLLGGLILTYVLAPVLDRTPAEGSPQWVSNELQLADTHYQNAIWALERIVDEGQTALDPEVVAVLRQNLTLIEDAIVESRAAAREEPTNPAGGESLLAALRQKVRLLQNTVLLINEIRKQQGEAVRNIPNDRRDSQTANEDSSG